MLYFSVQEQVKMLEQMNDKKSEDNELYVDMRSKQGMVCVSKQKG